MSSMPSVAFTPSDNTALSISPRPTAMLRGYLGAFKTLLEKPDWEEPLLAIGEWLAEAKRDQRRIYTMGNGGSAANAAHLALHLQEARIDAVDLLAQTPVVTASSNDYGYEYVAQRQLKGWARRGDGIIVFSVSGTSPNVLRAVEEAQQLGMRTVGFIGRDHNTVGNFCDHLVISHSAEYGPVEDFHSLCIHILRRLLTA